VRILELISFINGRVPDVYYPNRFPTTASDSCVAVRLTGGFPTDQWTGKKQPSFQILVRGTKTSEVEERAYHIHDSLTNLRNVKIGDDPVVVIRSNNSVPIHIGEDENNRPIYSMNFDCVVRP
jgi:hypothetical protein